MKWLRINVLYRKYIFLELFVFLHFSWKFLYFLHFSFLFSYIYMIEIEGLKSSYDKQYIILFYYPLVALLS